MHTHCSGCRYEIKAYCLHEGFGPERGVPSMGDFRRDPSRIYASFREKHGKLSYHSNNFNILLEEK